MSVKGTTEGFTKNYTDSNSWKFKFMYWISWNLFFKIKTVEIKIHVHLKIWRLCFCLFVFLCVPCCINCGGQWLLNIKVSRDICVSVGHKCNTTTVHIKDYNLSRSRAYISIAQRSALSDLFATVCYSRKCDNIYQK